MYKLVVLCAFLVVAAAVPDVLLTAPLTSYTTYVAPATTTISKQASSVIHPSPLVYNAPLSYVHLIKKHSPQLPLTYFAPTTYLTTGQLATTYSTPYRSAGPFLIAGSLPITTAHLIKKRSVPILSTAFVAPSAYSAASPLVASAYSAPLISSSPVIASAPHISQPYGFTTYLFKKRSAPI